MLAGLGKDSRIEALCVEIDEAQEREIREMKEQIASELKQRTLQGAWYGALKPVDPLTILLGNAYDRIQKEGIVDKREKHTYEAPRLTTYGDLTALTKRPAAGKSS